MTTPPELQAIAERQLCGLVNGLAQRIAEHVRERASAWASPRRRRPRYAR